MKKKTILVLALMLGLTTTVISCKKSTCKVPETNGAVDSTKVDTLKN